MYVYKIINNITKDEYVGKTVFPITERFKTHIYNSKKGNTYLYKAIRKYGKENFNIQLLEIVKGDIENLNESEKFWILKLKPKYNMTLGGDGGDTSKWLTEYYTKHSIRMKGNNNPFYGKTHSKETKEKISKAKKGKLLSKETKEKISNTLTGRKMSLESIEKRTRSISKKWKIIYPDNKELIIFNLSKFCRENNLDQRNMSKVAAGLQKTSKGFKCERL